MIHDRLDDLPRTVRAALADAHGNVEADGVWRAWKAAWLDAEDDGRPQPACAALAEEAALGLIRRTVLGFHRDGVRGGLVPPLPVGEWRDRRSGMPGQRRRRVLA